MPDIEMLFRQAPMTAKDYMIHAKIDIDDLFGEGYAEAHPELVGAFINAAALDYQAGFIGASIREAGEMIEGAVSDLEIEISRLSSETKL